MTRPLDALRKHALRPTTGLIGISPESAKCVTQLMDGLALLLYEMLDNPENIIQERERLCTILEDYRRL